MWTCLYVCHASYVQVWMPEAGYSIFSLVSSRAWKVAYLSACYAGIIDTELTLSISMLLPIMHKNSCSSFLFICWLLCSLVFIIFHYVNMTKNVEKYFPHIYFHTHYHKNVINVFCANQYFFSVIFLQPENLPVVFYESRTMVVFHPALAWCYFIVSGTHCFSWEVGISFNHFPFMKYFFLPKVTFPTLHFDCHRHGYGWYIILHRDYWACWVCKLIFFIDLEKSLPAALPTLQLVPFVHFRPVGIT